LTMAMTKPILRLARILPSRIATSRFLRRHESLGKKIPATGHSEVVWWPARLTQVQDDARFTVEPKKSTILVAPASVIALHQFWPPRRRPRGKIMRATWKTAGVPLLLGIGIGIGVTINNGWWQPTLAQDTASKSPATNGLYLGQAGGNKHDHLMADTPQPHQDIYQNRKQEYVNRLRAVPRLGREQPALAGIESVGVGWVEFSESTAPDKTVGSEDSTHPTRCRHLVFSWRI
jgi:hypothetical protein